MNKRSLSGLTKVEQLTLLRQQKKKSGQAGIRLNEEAHRRRKRRGQIQVFIEGTVVAVGPKTVTIDIGRPGQNMRYRVPHDDFVEAYIVSGRARC